MLHVIVLGFGGLVVTSGLAGFFVSFWRPWPPADLPPDQPSVAPDHPIAGAAALRDGALLYEIAGEPVSGTWAA
jgi:hypothetical protein